jgi:glycosyltransferase involved in cell wall biosynthesis
MRIGFDATAAVTQGAGIGRYTRELLRALGQLDTESQYRLFYAAARPTYPLPSLPGNFRATRLPFHDIWLARVWHRARVPLPAHWITGPIDLFHSPDFTLPPLNRHIRSLLTVHDLSFARDPESAAPGLRAYLNQVVPRSVARADHLLADSAATRNDLIELYRAPPEKITVLYSGVHEMFQPIRGTALDTVRAKYGVGQRPFILAVGTLQPRKNYTRLIQAFAMLPNDLRRNTQLIIAGGKGWLYDSIFAEVERLGARDQVRFPGFVEDDDLPALISAARVMAYPSLYEGFGLPILEGFACHTPVVTSTASCLPEVAGEAALLVDPTHVEALSAALATALTDEGARQTLVARGAERVRLFCWEKAARALLGVYQKVAT